MAQHCRWCSAGGFSSFGWHDSTVPGQDWCDYMFLVAASKQAAKQGAKAAAIHEAAIDHWLTSFEN
jgi:hypothetical protein